MSDLYIAQNEKDQALVAYVQALRDPGLDAPIRSRATPATRCVRRFCYLDAMSRMKVLVRGLACAGGLAWPSAGDVDAQERPRPWRASVQANGSIFFGNAEHRVFGSRTSFSHADSSLEVGADFQSLYGEAAVGGGPREVTKRVWSATASLDLRPFARLSPFVFGTLESNLEKRIAARYGAGGGAKYTFVRTDRTESSVSLALMDEVTLPREPTPAVVVGGGRLTRWSWRARVRHAFSDRVRASHVTFWRPSVARVDRYVVLSTTEVELKLTRVLGLTASFVDSYDSEAVGRGARTYNDGQLLFGAMASW